MGAVQPVGKFPSGRKSSTSKEPVVDPPKASLVVHWRGSQASPEVEIEAVNPGYLTSGLLERTLYAKILPQVGRLSAKARRDERKAREAVNGGGS